MNFLRLVFLGLAFFVSLFSYSISYALQFSNFFFFGDSLSDVGNRSEAPRTTNRGPLWANWLGSYYGTNITPSNNGGTDYARYGDQTGSLGPIDFFRDGGVLNQISQILNQYPKGLDPKAAYFMWAGANDYLDNVSFYCATDILGTRCKSRDENNVLVFDKNKIHARINVVQNQAVANIISSLNQLRQAGAKYLFAINLPELGLTPGGYDQQKNLPALANASVGMIPQFNAALSQQINALPYDVVQIDIYGYLNYVANNGARFGFTNTTQAWCTNIGPFDNSCNANVNANPDTYLFFDSVHPGEQAHRDIADFIYYGYLLGPTYYSLLADVPFATMNVHTNAINTLFKPYTVLTEKGPIKTWTAFATGSYSPSETPTINSSYPFQSSNDDFAGTVGGYYRLNDNVMFGAAFSPTVNKLNVDDLYQVEINEMLASVFGQYEWEQAYINSILSFGIPTYSNIKRTIPIGQTEFISQANTTHGQHYGAQINLGAYFIKLKHFATGPYAGLDYQYIKVNGYNETFDLTAAMLNFFDQSNKVLTSTLGWQINTQITNVGKPTFAQLYTGLKTQHIGQDRDIRFETANLPGSHGAIPTSGAKGSYGNLGAAITTFPHKKLGLTFSAQTNFGNSDFNQQIYSLTASFLFN